ncbi:MAG: DUF885 domain-containing protein [Caulobacteraceae bacterium]|nr:DUF885 domain-containing protein [Caulobacteraceae bacterium]
MLRYAVPVALVLAGLSASAAPARAPEPAEQAARLDRLADRAVKLYLNYDPTIAYFTGLPAPDHRRWADVRPAALRAFERESDAIRTELAGIDEDRLPPASEPTYANLREQLESEQQVRVCRAELWMGVSHMTGWHLSLGDVAREQPVGTADERTQALERWSSVPALVDAQIANLREGLRTGYSSPKSVVQRVIGQVEGLAALPAADSPLNDPAKRSEDAAFKAAFTEVIGARVNPALKRYAEFLKTEYLPRAREALAISTIPHGRECYQAQLRGYTTLNRSPQEVYDIGRAAVERNTAEVLDTGERLFGVRDFAAIVARVAEAPENRFHSEAEMIAFARDTVARAREKVASLFPFVPAQSAIVEPFEAYMRGSGASSHYEPQSDPAKPAIYRINSDNWATETRGAAEITALHEAYPGHHMQIAYARALPQTDIAKLSFNSAYIEGWARYSERLSEEAGIYATPYALISRRTWPARGMVADPGMHVLGWTREQTIEYLASSGRFSRREAADTVDRMAIMPGQLASYDSGGLEILALREQARRELGDRFDLKAFHGVVLGGGVLPLSTLRRHVEAWIAAEKAKP